MVHFRQVALAVTWGDLLLHPNFNIMQVMCLSIMLRLIRLFFVINLNKRNFHDQDHRLFFQRPKSLEHWGFNLIIVSQEHVETAKCNCAVAMSLI